MTPYEILPAGNVHDRFHQKTEKLVKKGILLASVVFVLGILIGNQYGKKNEKEWNNKN